MTGTRWLFLVAALDACVLRASAGSKEVVAHIQCAVCKQAVKEASVRAKGNSTLIDDEDELTDALEHLCSASKDAGKWITKIDVIQKEPGAQLSLDRRDVEGTCQSECKSVQKACTAGLKGREDTLVSLIKDGAGVGKLQREVCKKPCAKSIPELGQWQDEPFKVAMPPPPTTTPPPVDKKEKDGDERLPEVERVSRGDSDIVPDILAHSFAEMGMPAADVIDDINQCYNTAEDLKKACDSFLDDATKGIQEMMQKELDAMRSGLATLGRSVAKLTETFEKTCENASLMAGLIKMYGEKLSQYAWEASEVEYEPMKSLKVHGHDIHQLLNSFIAAWQKKPADGKVIGTTLAKVLMKVEGGDDAEKSKSEL